MFGDSLGDSTADEILRALQQARDEGMTRTDLSNFFGRHTKSAEITRALQLLQQMDLAHYVMEPSGGKSTERWFIGAAKKANYAN